MERACKECIPSGPSATKKNNDLGARNKKSKVCTDNIEKLSPLEIKLNKVHPSKLTYSSAATTWNGIW